MASSDRVRIESWSPDYTVANISTLQSIPQSTILLLPDRIDNTTRLALYQESVVGLVKSINAESTEGMSFAWPSNERTYLSEYGATEIIFSLALGVIGNLSTDALKIIVRAVRVKIANVLGSGTDNADGDAEINVKIGRIDAGSGRVIEGFEYTGPAAEVVELIEGILPQAPDESNG